VEGRFTINAKHAKIAKNDLDLFFAVFAAFAFLG